MEMDKLKEAIFYGFSSVKRSSITVLSSLLIFFILLWASNPTQASRTLSFGVGFIDEAIMILIQGSIATIGLSGFFLLMFYSIMSGITMTAIGGQIKHQGLSNTAKAGGIAPGILASGCAGCGTGLLSLLGASSVIALMPFNGNLIRLAGMMPLLYFLKKSGDPRTCAIES